MDGSCSRMTSLLTRCGTPKDSLQRTATSTLVPLERRKGFVTDFLLTYGNLLGSTDVARTGLPAPMVGRDLFAKVKYSFGF